LLTTLIPPSHIRTLTALFLNPVKAYIDSHRLNAMVSSSTSVSSSTNGIGSLALSVEPFSDLERSSSRPAGV
jgi:hypothetical protein